MRLQIDWQGDLQPAVKDKAHYRLCMTVLNAYSVSSETEAQVNERSTLSLQRLPPSEQTRTGDDFDGLSLAWPIGCRPLRLTMEPDQVGQLTFC
jgi:hypothetical protein